MAQSSSSLFEFRVNNSTCLMIWRPGNDFVYPEEAKKRSIEGDVHFSFLLDSVCNIRDLKIIRSPEYGLDSAVYRAILASRVAVYVDEKETTGCAAVNGRIHSSAKCVLR